MNEWIARLQFKVLSFSPWHLAAALRDGLVSSILQRMLSRWGNGEGIALWMQSSAFSCWLVTDNALTLAWLWPWSKHCLHPSSSISPFARQKEESLVLLIWWAEIKKWVYEGDCAGCLGIIRWYLSDLPWETLKNWMETTGLIHLLLTAPCHPAWSFPLLFCPILTT